jgi:hypothetical protein
MRTRNGSEPLATKLCGRCKKNVAAKGYKSCKRCIDAQRLRKIVRKRWAEESGTCMRCYRAPAEDGCRSCASCRDILGFKSTSTFHLGAFENKAWVPRPQDTELALDLEPEHRRRYIAKRANPEDAPIKPVYVLREAESTFFNSRSGGMQ